MVNNIPHFPQVTHTLLLNNILFFSCKLVTLTLALSYVLTHRTLLLDTLIVSWALSYGLTHSLLLFHGLSLILLITLSWINSLFMYGHSLMDSLTHPYFFMDSLSYEPSRSFFLLDFPYSSLMDPFMILSY